MNAVMFSYGKPTGSEAARLAAGVGRLVADRRIAYGWTYAETGRRSGMAGSTVSQIERGVSRPSWSALCRLAATFEPTDRAAAGALAERLAAAAGPSLAGAPDLPAGLSRELVVEVLARAARALGMDVDDDRIREVVADELRAVTGERSADAGSGTVLAIEAAPRGGPPP